MEVMVRPEVGVADKGGAAPWLQGPLGKPHSEKERKSLSSLLIPASPSLANSELQLVWEAAHLCLVINSSFA